MKSKPINSNLLSKVKEALIKSGFPLELNVAKIMESKGWNCSIASQYLDFESNKLRESDIIAEKSINGISVNLMIECKKSDEKQLVLYQPTVNSKSYASFRWIKLFPEVETVFVVEYDEDGEPFEYEIDAELHNDLLDYISLLPSIDVNNELSKGIIFTKGNTVEQNNSAFFSSMNSIVKRSIVEHSKMGIDSKVRKIYIYVVIYDGYILKLTRASDEVKGNEFDLLEVGYGQYLADIRFALIEEPSLTNKAIIKQFGNEFIIEIMKPSMLSSYLDAIEIVLNGIPKEILNGWGEDGDLPF